MIRTARLGQRAREMVLLVSTAVLLGGLLVLAAGTQPADAAYPGANGKIAFTRVPLTATGGGTIADAEIWTMNPDGSGERRLTRNSVEDGGASYARFGTKISFYSMRSGRGDIYVMNSDGSGQKRLTTNAARDFYPAISADGSKIAFASTRGGDGVDESGDPDNEIWVMKAAPEGATNKPVRLTNNDASEGNVRWSRDGKKLLFTSRRDDPKGDIYTMNADGSNPRRLTKAAGFDGTADFSPDGTKIVFRSDRDGDPEIYKMNVALESSTNRPVKLTNNALEEENPLFSPDGKKVAFARNTSTEGAFHQIYTVNADGSGGKKLTAAQAYHATGDWQAK